MKQLNILLAAVFFCMNASAQTDTTTNAKKSDTMRIGNIIIIKKGKGSDGNKASIEVNKEEFERKHSKKITTNWWQVDIGFANYDDKTNYTTANAGNYLVNSPGSPAFSKSDLKLRTGKSINVNIWVFMQKINLIKKNVNLKYGLGVELNNYRYKTSSLLSYKEGGVIPYSGGVQTNSPFIFRDSVNHFSKNKLAADYLTVPVMLNFSTTPRYNKPTFGFSAGVSFGYLYSQRNKQKSDERGKLKNKGDYDLEKFKLSYVAEIGLGSVKLYGSYSPKSMYEHSLDVRPYNFGIRLSNW
ncbi:MAG: outer membrane beta-barrel protein [Ferruginibacter sp.]